MEESLDRKLCEKYPKIFRDRHASMQQTAMCWGLAVGDGWYNIINSVCGLIQHHINHTRKTRADTIKFNRALKRAFAGDKNGLVHYYTYEGASPEWIHEVVDKQIKTASLREVPDVCPQVVAVQVKEKFGELRFYYDGGDSTIDGMVQMAEAMSYVTCEECGSPGKSSRDGWIRVLCDTHRATFEADRKARFGDT
jgi:hypothetical protein